MLRGACPQEITSPMLHQGGSPASRAGGALKAHCNRGGKRAHLENTKRPGVEKKNTGHLGRRSGAGGAFREHKKAGCREKKLLSREQAREIEIRQTLITCKKNRTRFFHQNCLLRLSSSNFPLSFFTNTYTTVAVPRHSRRGGGTY